MGPRPPRRLLGGWGQGTQVELWPRVGLSPLGRVLPSEASPTTWGGSHCSAPPPPGLPYSIGSGFVTAFPSSFYHCLVDGWCVRVVSLAFVLSETRPFESALDCGVPAVAQQDWRCLGGPGSKV